MHTIELLEETVALAVKMGYSIRQEWLGGDGGGACEIRGQKWVFLDLALPPREQLEQVLDAVRDDPQIGQSPLSDQLIALLGRRKSA